MGLIYILLLWRSWLLFIVFVLFVFILSIVLSFILGLSFHGTSFYGDYD